jgi:hypothetical protein
MAMSVSGVVSDESGEYAFIIPKKHISADNRFDGIHGAKLLFHGVKLIFHGVKLIFHGVKLIFHGVKLIFHGVKLIFHGVKLIFHGVKLLFHGVKLLFHGVKLLFHGVKLLFHGVKHCRHTCRIRSRTREAGCTLLPLSVRQIIICLISLFPKKPTVMI